MLNAAQQSLFQQLFQPTKAAKTAQQAAAQAPPYTPPPPAYQVPANNTVQQYGQFLQDPGQLDQIGMVQADPTSYLQNNIFKLPQFQMLYGNGPNSTNLDPTQRFQFDPGYQFAQNEGMKQLQQQGSAKGLLESGPMQRQLLQFSQGMADQNYQRWLGQQQGLFSDYQNRLANLATMGAQNTGSQAALQTGQGLSNNSLATGSNISSLFGNQGVFGGNAMLNTGAAQSNNLMQSAALQAQIDSANQANSTAQMGSLFSGIGQIAGMMF